jgi:hypothetical protein
MVLTGTSHENLVIRDSSFNECSSSNGGGMYIFRRNANTVIKGCTFDGCMASGGSGGAIRFWDQNIDTLIVDIEVDSCVANAGGGLAFEEVSRLYCFVKSQISDVLTN